MKLKADEDALIADEEAKDADDEDVDELPVYSWEVPGVYYLI